MRPGSRPLSDAERAEVLQLRGEAHPDGRPLGYHVIARRVGRHPSTVRNFLEDAGLLYAVAAETGDSAGEVSADTSGPGTGGADAQAADARAAETRAVLLRARTAAGLLAVLTAPGARWRLARGPRGFWTLYSGSRSHGLTAAPCEALLSSGRLRSAERYPGGTTTYRAAGTAERQSTRTSGDLRPERAAGPRP